MTSKNNLTPSQIMRRIRLASPTKVWTPRDFLDLGKRDIVDKALQRMVTSNELRRIDRGLYDQLRHNTLTGRFAPPDYREVIEAVSRCAQVRVLIDGMTAANDLGWTNAVPAKVIVHTDGRLCPIQLDQLIIQFKLTAPSKLYWAGRPAARIVQALYWLCDSLKSNCLVEQNTIQSKILRLLQDPNQGATIRGDLQLGLYTLPSWMQDWLRDLFARSQNGSSRE